MTNPWKKPEISIFYILYSVSVSCELWLAWFLQHIPNRSSFIVKKAALSMLLVKITSFIFFLRRINLKYRKEWPLYCVHLPIARTEEMVISRIELSLIYVELNQVFSSFLWRSRYAKSANTCYASASCVASLLAIAFAFSSSFFVGLASLRSFCIIYWHKSAMKSCNAY
jgi:hypothetical protein